VAFKHDAYLKVVEAFSPIAKAGAGGDTMVRDARGTILMIHGVGCTGRAWDRFAADFRSRGWMVEAPTLKADLRVQHDPPAALAEVTLADYVAEAEGWAREIETKTGRAPVLFGHSMGGLLVQKLLERGVGRAGVLVTPASPASVTGGVKVSTLFTFLNILLTPKPETKPHKVWRTGFEWGVLNCVPKSHHAAIYAEAVYDSGRVYDGLRTPETDPGRTGFIDESKIAVPMLVIAAAQDRTIPLDAVKATAAKYAKCGAEYREYRDNGHWIVDEPGTDKVISDIDTWLGEHVG
jgi:alpha-beta hydrolase superfamily lysophospholipase